MLHRMLAFQGFFNRLQRNYESEEKVAQPCSPLCDPMDYKVRGILQARILQWVAFPFSDLPNPGIEPRSSALQADSLPCELQGLCPLPVRGPNLGGSGDG